MLKIFRTNQPYVYVLLLLYTIVLHTGFLVFSVKASAPVDYSFAGMYFAEWLVRPHITFWMQAVDMIILFGEALFFNFIFTSNRLFSRSTHIPAFIFITLSACFGDWMVFSVETVARLFLLLSLYNLFALYEHDLSRENIFYTSLYLSIGCLFYFPVIVFLPIILGGLFIRSYSIRDFMLILIGFLFPFYVMGIGFYYKDKLTDYLLHLQKIFTPKTLLFDLSVAEISFLAFILFLSAYGYVLLRGDSEYNVIKKGRLFNLILIFLLIVILAAPFILNHQMSYLRLLIIPVSVFAARIFDRESLNYFQIGLFCLLIGGIILFQAGYLGLISVPGMEF